jgi:hypothetical protein
MSSKVNSVDFKSTTLITLLKFARLHFRSMSENGVIFVLIDHFSVGGSVVILKVRAIVRMSIRTMSPANLQVQSFLLGDAAAV